VNTISVKCP